MRAVRDFFQISGNFKRFKKNIINFSLKLKAPKYKPSFIKKKVVKIGVSFYLS